MAGLRERQKSERSNRILDVARQRFDEQGYSDVSLESIAEDAGVSVVTVYNYFGSKAGLLLALVKESDFLLIRQLKVLIASAPADMREGVAHFGQIMRRHVVKYLTRPTWRQILAASIIEGGTSFGQSYLKLDEVLIDTMEEMVAVYRTRGTLVSKVEPRALADTLFSLQNMRFFQFVADDNLTEEEVDGKLRADLEAFFESRLILRSM
ncbi:TetR/AcrR family transcriptional regulator [Mesorhizobium sp. A623]